MPDLELQAATRQEIGKAVKTLRSEGKIPGVVYGHGTEPATIAVDTKELERLYGEAGGSKLITLKIDGKDTKNALFHEIQQDPLTGQLTHFDLYEVRMDEEIETEIPIHYTGESPAVFNEGGILLKSMDTVEVQALPGDLPESFEIDIGTLKEINDTIHVSDLKVSDKVTILNDPEEVVAKIDPPRSEEELEALEEEVPAEGEEAEMVESEHGGEEAEEGEEGEEAAGTEAEEGESESEEPEEPKE